MRVSHPRFLRVGLGFLSGYAINPTNLRVPHPSPASAAVRVALTFQRHNRSSRFWISLLCALCELCVLCVSLFLPSFFPSFFRSFLLSSVLSVSFVVKSLLSVSVLSAVPLFPLW